MSGKIIPVVEKHSRYVVHFAKHGAAHVRHRRKQYAIGLGIFLVVILGLQLGYPSDRAVPFARVNGQNIGLKTQDNIVDTLYGTYNDSPLSVQIRDKTIKTNLSKAGITVNYAATAKQTTDYPLWQRFIPLSFVYKMITTNSVPQTLTDKSQAAELLVEVQKMCAVTPKNASVKVDGESLTLEKSVNGAECKTNDIIATLARYPPKPHDNTLRITPNTVKPHRSDAQVQAKLAEAQTIVGRKLELNVNGKITEVSRLEKTKWITFQEDEKTKQINVALSDEPIVAYLQTAQKEVYIAPGTTTVSLTDGIETSRVAGSAGRGIETTKTSQAMKAVLLGSEPASTVTALLAVLPPTEKINRNYTNTPRGLQVLLDDIAREKGGYGITLTELSGQKRRLSASGSKAFTAASTYKMFVAYSVLKRVESGQIKWSDSVANGRDAAQCFEDMIVRSDNPCAEEWGKRIGWKTIENEVRGLGLGSTRLGTAFTTTAQDQALFIEKLEQSESLKGESRDRLLSAMKRQIYRAGIPAGTGVSAANKVGFLDGYLNDSAIVYSPKGTYVLAILSKDSSWGNIADAARRINTLLNS